MAKKFKTALFFGPPGSGKGTQGKVVGNLPGFVHVASGDLFRALDKASELGKIFVEYSSKGLLVPDDFTVRLWKDHMERMMAAGKFNPASDTLILDGIPRNVAQAKMLDRHIDVQKMIVLRVDSDLESIVQRMKQRAQKEGRLDDANEATIRNRFAVYDNETKPMLDHYPKKVRADVDALQSPIAVAHDVICALLGRTKEMRKIKMAKKAAGRRAVGRKR
jgi:adenylate kinase